MKSVFELFFFSFGIHHKKKMKDRKMNKQNEYVKKMVCVERGGERRTQKKKYEFQMGFQPTTFRIIGPRNIYIF